MRLWFLGCNLILRLVLLATCSTGWAPSIVSIGLLIVSHYVTNGVTEQRFYPPASYLTCWISRCARVAKLADASDLGSDVLGRGGSSPSTRTIFTNGLHQLSSGFLTLSNTIRVAFMLPLCYFIAVTPDCNGPCIKSKSLQVHQRWKGSVFGSLQLGRQEIYSRLQH